MGVGRGYMKHVVLLEKKRHHLRPSAFAKTRLPGQMPAQTWSQNRWAAQMRAFPRASLPAGTGQKNQTPWPGLCDHSWALMRYLDCFFLPTTTCPLPKDWRDRAVRMPSTPAEAHLNMTAEIVSVAATTSFTYTNTTLRTWRYDQVEHVTLSNIPALVEHRDKTSQWWMAQLMKFMLRPSDYTLKHLVWPVQQGAFYRTQQ